MHDDALPKCDAAGDLLNTSISGVGRAWSASGLARLALAHGWMTLAIIARIHYQAVVLFAKRVPFFRKPQPPNTALTRSIEARPADPHQPLTPHSS